MNFRLDINGLRFIAVSMVVLFHFKFNFAYGGFAGVDIFFVISGFLMNEICQKQIGKKRWVIDFYKKRFKRIYPALLCSVLFFFIVLTIFYPPSITKNLYQQVISALTFTSNIFYFFESSGYFSKDVDGYFLLHTWSLSAEWQFYLIFPFVMLIANKIRIKNILSYVYAIAIILSFSLCVIVALKNVSASFYWLPTRAWELFLGAFVSTLKFKNKYARATELISIITIVMFTFFVKSSAVWPGVMTLVPTFAVAALIHARIDNEKSILRFKPIQEIGYASYSIYLFHWPIVSIFYLSMIEFTLFNSAVAVAASVVMGFLSYYLIEKKNKATFLKLAVVSCSFMLISFIVSYSNISKAWISEEVIALDKYYDYFETDEGRRQFGNENRTCFLTSTRNNVNFFDEKTCLIKSKKNKRLLLIGDSHAGQFYDAVKGNFPEYDVMEAAASGCLPFVNTKGESRCTILIRNVFDKYINQQDIDLVIVSANWITGAKDYGGIDSVEKMILESNEKLSSSVKNVIFLGQTKEFDYPVYRIVQLGKSEKIKNYEVEETKAFSHALKSALDNKSINYINIYDYGCDGECSYVDANGVPFMFDKNHMTIPWANRVMNKVREDVDVILDSKN